MFRERKFQGTKVPGNESSTLWNFRSRERKFFGTKVPATVKVMSIGNAQCTLHMILVELHLSSAPALVQGQILLFLRGTTHHETAIIKQGIANSSQSFVVYGSHFTALTVLNPFVITHARINGHDATPTFLSISS